MNINELFNWNDSESINNTDIIIKEDDEIFNDKINMDLLEDKTIKSTKHIISNIEKDRTSLRYKSNNNDDVSDPSINPEEINKYLFIGKFDKVNNYLLENIKEKYKPFINQVFKEFDLFNLIKELKRPLIRNKQLIILTAEMNNNNILNLILKLEDIKYSYSDIVINIIPKEKYRKINSQHIKIINLRESYRENFIEFLKKQFPLVDIDTVNYIAKRLNYSSKRLELYKEELLKETNLTEYRVNNIITTKTSISIDEMVYRVLIKDKKGYIMYNELCERYSINWTITYIKDFLKNILMWKTMIKKDKKNFQKLKLESMYMYKTVVEVNSSDILILRHFISNLKIFNIELYYLFDKDLKLFNR